MRAPETSLRSRLALALAGLPAALVLVLVVLFVAGLDVYTTRSADLRAQSTADLLGATVEPALDFGDPRAVTDDLRALASNPEVGYVLVRNGAGHIFASWVRVGVEPPPPSDLRRDAGGMIHVLRPLATRGGERGSIQLGLLPRDLLELRERAISWGLGASLTLLLGGAAAGLLLAGRLTMPLRSVTRVALRIAAGDHDAAAELDGRQRDETGQLARALRRMLEHLYEQKAAVDRLNRDLEFRVEERTAELRQKLAELRSTQDQLVVADRRQSIGQLAAGVAHEVNNPLAYVSGNVTFVRAELERLDGGATLDDELRVELMQALAEARQGCERVRFIVQSLKTFSRGDDDTRTVLSLADPLEAASRITANEVKYCARLVREVGPAPLVAGNEIRLAQVFVNLLVNAAQAIGPGGADRNEIRCTIDTAPDGRARARVSDTGCGMTPDVLSRIFVPFFTTKPVGAGTGLGLSVCQGIVASLGGEIQVESEPGRGTTFTVLLPAAEHVDVNDDALDAPGVRPTYGGRLLIVDDELMLGRSLERSLGRHHDVVVATGADEALAALSGGRFDVVLCDLMMPGASGMELYAEIERRWPDLAARVLFMTGGAFTPDARAFAEQNAARLLDKPIDPDRLQERLRPLLGNRPENCA